MRVCERRSQGGTGNPNHTFMCRQGAMHEAPLLEETLQQLIKRCDAFCAGQTSVVILTPLRIVIQSPSPKESTPDEGRCRTCTSVKFALLKTALSASTFETMRTRTQSPLDLKGSKLSGQAP